MTENNKRNHEFDEIGWALISSQLAMFVISVALSLLLSLLFNLIVPLQRTWATARGYVTILAALGGLMPMLALSIKNASITKILSRNSRVWPVEIIMLFFTIMGLQILMNMLMIPIIELMEKAGFSFMNATNIATSYSTSASMVMYSVIIAPICEEILYRGVLLRSLERYGRWFSIIISALFFGLMHGNAVQFPVAVIIGLVFAYLALKYSLTVTIVLHVLNNLAVDILDRVSEMYPTEGTLLSIGVMIAGIISLILMLMSAGKPLIRDIQLNRTQKGTYKRFFISKPVAVVTVYLILLTISSIIK